jgi:uncharacterized protein (DUF58 family)
MPQVTDYLTPSDLQKIGNLQVLARLVVEGFCTGLHRSPHKGFSVEFKQHRQYVPGDEIRHLDWKVFGKTDRFYIREYEEETNLRATILLDESGSMAYGSESETGISKQYYGTRVAAALAYLMLQQQDSVGLVTFDEQIRRYIPPRSRPSHLKVVIDEMEKAKPGGESELADVFLELSPKLHRRGLLVIVSDCFCDATLLIKALANFRHDKHEIIIFQIWDRDELEFPFKQWTRFDCLESIGMHRLVDPAHLRRDYLAALEKFRDELEQGCHRHRIDLVPLITDQPYADALAQYLALRKRRA